MSWKKITYTLRELNEKLEELLDELGLEAQYEDYVAEFNDSRDEDDDYDEPIDFDDWLQENKTDESVRQYLNAVEELDCFPSDETIIVEEYFTDYVRDLVAELYEIDEPLKNYIDYEAFASDLRSDYTEGEFLGTVYMWLNS